MLWTRDPKIVENTHLLLSLIVVGCLLNATVTMPYMLQLAYGWTSLSFYKNIVAIIILIPLLFLLVHYLGAVGGAITWMLLNAGYVIFEVPIMHSRILPRQKWKWYRVDIGYPMVISISIIGMVRFFLSSSGSPVLNLPWMAMAVLLAVIVSASILPVSQDWIKKEIYGRIVSVL